MTGTFHLLRRPLAAALLAMALALPGPALAQPAASPPPAATAPGAAPATPTAPPEPATRPDIMLQLPRDLSPWGMFRNADVVVKAVMIGLAFASLLTWTIWFAKVIELMVARRRLRRAIAAIAAAGSFEAALARLDGISFDALALAQAADAEVRMSADALVAEGVKERIASRLERIEAGAGRRMIRGTGWLATVGATAPFVGLFGTVWGIMNSFIGISRQHTTNLAVVAPGIAEALLATALGLVAAIPAVVMYNMFSRWNAGYRALLADCAAEVLRLVGRDLDRGVLARRPAERPRAATAAE
jgi:biopolymer transport protein ExbB